MKTLYETADYSEALVIKSLLEQAGFPAFIDNFNTLTAMPHLTAGLGLRVMVPDDDFTEAQQLLADVRAENAPAKATEDSIDTCPKCGSEDVARYTTIWLLPFLSAMNLLYPVPPGNRRVCGACGHRFKSKGPAIARPLKIAITVWVIVIMLIFAAGNVWTPNFELPWWTG
ncbi:DUF2007 domain-containing protein [Kordiimonas lacus]|uniref:Putative signal transducing protein n=1 Tax=Kordiimonas lacus TaxID=637679 RepID=A0A1G7F1M5_9PROT|nr:DUF2007 domain-containing protein [Kordiimonas lacus]SDE69646.1 Putative signal transducing protein [Kordiimonas lacus]